MSRVLQNLFISLCVPTLILWGVWYVSTHQTDILSAVRPNIPIMHIGDLKLQVEMATTDELRVRGLSGRASIGNHVQGMLFIFPDSNYHGIWMKEMKFPIDIVWIAEDHTIIGVDSEVQPDTFPRIFRPVRPARYVLETESGYTSLVGITAGQKVRLPGE